MPTTTSQIGNALRDARVRAGLTQKEAARLLGFNKQTISRWERGEHGARVEDYEKAMARYTEVVTRPGEKVGQSVPRGTLSIPARLAPVVERFQREILRMGADDFEVDHVMSVLRAPEVVRLFNTGAPEQQDAELETQLETLKTWVTLHMRQRTPHDQRPAYFRAAEAHGATVVTGSLQPPRRPTKRAAAKGRR